MQFSGVSLITILILFCSEVSAQPKSWAQQLRSAKRKSPPKRSQHGTKGYFRMPFLASESGAKQTASYSMPTQPETYRAPGCYGAPPGSYGDPATYCKSFHICQADGRYDVMDCPASLRFNNYLGVCDWPDRVDPYCNPIYYPTKERNEYQYKDHDQHRYSEYPPPSQTDRYRERDRDLSYAAAEMHARRTNSTEVAPQLQIRTMKEIQERLLRAYENGLKIVNPQTLGS